MNAITIDEAAALETAARVMLDSHVSTLARLADRTDPIGKELHRGYAAKRQCHFEVLMASLAVQDGLDGSHDELAAALDAVMQFDGTYNRVLGACARMAA